MEGMYVKKKIIVFVTFLLILTTLEVKANIASKFLAVPNVKQEQSLWCWSASGVSILGYKGKNISQSSYARAVKGSTANQSATDREVRSGLLNWGVSSTQSTSAISFTEVVNQVNNNRPIYAGLSWYSSGNRTGGHAVVIRGYVTESGTNYVSYMDPANGTRYSMAYNDFRGGTSKSRHWDGTLYNVR